MDMKLSEFVELTLCEIVEGVKIARKKTGVHIASTYPDGFTPIPDPQMIEFELNIAVTEQISSGRESGVSVPMLSVISAGIKGTRSTDNATETVQKIRFSVPIYKQFEERKG